MVKRVIIGRSGEERLVDLIQAIERKATAGDTRPTGVKVMDDDENFYWARSDGTTHSVREVDTTVEANVEFTEQIEQDLVEERGRITELKDVTLPNAVSALEQADQAAQQTLGELDTRLTAVDATGTGELATLRDALTAAQDAATAAQSTADDAVQAASAANQAALTAAGIADSKGKVIYSETEPAAEDQSTSNLWIKPSTEETRVWNETGQAWELITSDLLDQAAQNALDAKQAASAAQSTADSAKADAATAQAAAVAAQQTADQATLDARDAWNEAIAATDRLDAVRADMAQGPSLWEDPSFERGPGGIPALSPGRIDRTQEWASTPGGWSVKYTASGNSGNNYGVYGYLDLTPGRWYAVSVTVHAGDAPQQWRTVWDGRTAANATDTWLILPGTVDVPAGQTVKETWFFQVPETSVQVRYWAGQSATFNQPEHTGQTLFIDDFRLADVTESYPQYLAAQAAADAAQARADEAYSEAASKATPAEVQAAADAAEAAAKTAAAADATAKAEQAEADAAVEAARVATEKANAAEANAALTAQQKADAAEAAAEATAKAEDELLEARAAADAKAKADQALADANAALATARGEITAEITASANGKNSITISGSAPSGDGVVNGDTWWRIDGSSNVFGQWVWNGSAWIARQIRSEVIANLDVHKLQVTGSAEMDEAVIDKLWVDGIGAKSLTAQQVTVAPGNGFPDPAGLNVGTRSAVGGGAWSWDDVGKYWRRDAPTGGGTTQFNAFLNTVIAYDSMPLTPGEEYRVAYDVWVDVAGSASGRTAIYYRNDDGTTRFVGDGYAGQPVTANQWNRIERTWVVPAGVRSGGFGFQLLSTDAAATEVRIRNPFLGPKAGAVLIKDGAITAEKITLTGDPDNPDEAALSASIAETILLRTDRLVASGGEGVDPSVISELASEIITSGKFRTADTGARVEIAGDGIHAFNAAGDQTVTIVGEQGVFVGGEIRTSDTLPGQVILSDSGYVDSYGGGAWPGIQMVPPDTSGMATPPGIGARDKGMFLNAGRTTAGETAYAYFGEGRMYARGSNGSDYAELDVSAVLGELSATDGVGNSGAIRAQRNFASIRSEAADGSLGFIEAGHDYAVVGTKDPAGNYMSRIRSSGREAYLWSTGSDGKGRILSVDSDGIWVKTQRDDGFYDHFNLELTANDSGWIDFPVRPGIIASGSPAYRVKGGVVFFRGTLTSSSNWTSGWNVFVSGLPTEISPAAKALRPGASSIAPGMILQMTSAGQFEMWLPQSYAGSTTVQLSPMFYPIG